MRTVRKAAEEAPEPPRYHDTGVIRSNAGRYDVGRVPKPVITQKKRGEGTPPTSGKTCGLDAGQFADGLLTSARVSLTVMPPSTSSVCPLT
jgi:hypothetical protein